ncbi:hypothetical protein JCM16303_004656 [Sporobolomyces ruberrimus]
MLRSSSSRSLGDVKEESEDEEPTQPASTSSASSHTRQHSRIHARNLSEFFPRPGQSPGQGYGSTYSDPHQPGSSLVSRITDISQATPPRQSQPILDREGATSPRTQNRRGHHHRHSVSHNLFPFLGDPTSPTSPGSTPFSPSEPLTPSFSPSHLASSTVNQPELFSSSRSSKLSRKISFLPLFLQLPLYSLLSPPFPSSQLKIILSILQLSLGASLWITGQAGESLSVTGLGYLVVFDGLGLMSQVVLGKGGGLERWRTERGNGTRSGDNLQQPFGLVRLTTLSHFSQSIYLLFSAVYVCKESIEHVLLLHGPSEGGVGGGGEGHGSGHGGVGHGEGRIGGGGHAGVETINFPLIVLFLSATLSILSAILFKTHQELSETVVILQQPQQTSTSRTQGKMVSRKKMNVFNPFTMTVAGFGFGLFGAAIVLPPAQLSPLDKILSLLISLSMFYIAYPAASSTGKILLQTAPSVETKEGRGIKQGLKDIENHPLVVSIETQRVWQLVPTSSSSSTSTSEPSSTTTSSEGPSTIITLTVLVKSDVDERGLLEVSEWVEDRCRSAGNLGGGGGKGQREVTVEVKRAK